MEIQRESRDNLDIYVCKKEYSSDCKRIASLSGNLKLYGKHNIRA